MLITRSTVMFAAIAVVALAQPSLAGPLSGLGSSRARATSFAQEPITSQRIEGAQPNIRGSRAD